MSSRDHLETSPAKSVLLELDHLSRTLHTINKTYLTQLDNDLSEILQTVENVAEDSEDIEPSKIRDLRDMASILRSVKTKPEKGRRKDLKKVEDTIVELKDLIQSW